MTVSISLGPMPPPVAYRIVVGAARARRTNGAHTPARAPVVPPATNVRRVRATCLPVMGLSIWSCVTAQISLPHARRGRRNDDLGFGCQRLQVLTLVAAPIAGTDPASSFRRGRGNALDFDQHSRVGERRNADERAGGRIFSPEITGGDFIEDTLAFHLRRKDRE